MSRFFYSILILCAGVVAYASSLSNGFTFDDWPLIVQNPLVQQPDLWAVFSSPYWVGHPEYGLYRPLTTLSYALNQAIFGREPFGFHLINLCLHIGNALLLFALARVWLERRDAGLCALFFLLHPIQTEAVNSAVGRAELLAALWMLVGFLAYVHLTGWKRYACGALALLMGCLSKEHAATLFGLLVAFDVMYRLREPQGLSWWVRHDLPRYIPFVGVIAIFLWVRYLVVGGLLLPQPPNFVDNPLAHLPSLDRMAVAVAILGRYVGLLIWPHALSADYSFQAIPIEIHRLVGWFLLGMLTFCAVGGYLVSLSWRARTPVWGAGLAAALIPFVPVSNLLFPIGTLMAERLLYVPMIGVALLIGGGCGVLMDRWGKPVLVSVAVLLVAMGWRVHIRNPDWQNNETLFRSAVQAVPNSAKAHFNLGSAMRDRGLLEEALTHYARAVAIYPEYAEVYYNTGVIYRDLGQDEAAFEAYHRAVAVDSAHANAWNNLGVMWAQEGDHARAVEAFGRVLRVEPGRLDARLNYAQACEADGQIEAAISAYQAVLDRDPGREEVGLKLSDLYRQKGDLDRAISVLRRVMTANDQAVHAIVNLGVLLERQGRFSEAANTMMQAGEIGGDRSDLALLAAGRLYGRLGRFEEAREALRQFLDRWQGDPVLRQRAQKMLQSLPID